MKMKFLSLAIVSLIGMSAQANTYWTQCKFEDWSRIKAALKSGNVDAKPSVLRQLERLLIQELGVTCQREVWIMPSAKAPEYEHFDYLIQDRFSIGITWDKINRSFSRVSVDYR